MSGSISRQEIDILKAKVSLVSLFEAHGVKVKREGRGHKALCPWHEDGSVQDTCKNRSQGFEKDWSWLKRLWHRIHVKVVFTEAAEVFSCVGTETRDKARSNG